MSLENYNNVIIIDEESKFSADLEIKLKKLGYTVLGIICNYNDIINSFVEKNINIALINNNFKKEKTVSEITNIIIKKFNIPVIIIADEKTDNTNIEEIESKLLFFLEKSFKDSDLCRKIQIAQNYSTDLAQKTLKKPIKNKGVFVKEKGSYIKINIEDINWLEAMDNYTVIHSITGKYLSHTFLKDILEKLGNNFLRIHRSHAVALNKITSLEANTVFLGEKYLVVGKNYRNELLNKMKIL
ncbi:MAG: response regulator transcription factor [Bacteroidales bacterium]|nr:response regulator transcription factor [Bacteroidales bacterium]MBN2756707.1 response regulator transcription factor [Bacteroidales bacterium]